MTVLKQLLDDIAADAPSGQRLVAGTQMRVRQMRRRRSAVAALALGSVAATAGVLYDAAQPPGHYDQNVGYHPGPSELPSGATARRASWPATPSVPAPKPTVLPTAAPVDARTRTQVDAVRGTISEAQLVALEDGTVTHDEYVAAFQRLKSCVQADGFWPDLNPPWEENQVMIGVAYPDAAKATHDRCYPLEFKLVDMTWQVHRENFGPDAKAMANCLTQRGQTPGLTLVEKYEQLLALGVHPYKECVDVAPGK